MPRNYDQELQAIKADERKLADRRKAIVERRSLQLAKTLKGSELMKLEPARLDGLLDRIKALGMEEVERRLSI